MSTTVAARESLWMETAAVPARPKLDRDVMSEVCVVGAGIAGLTTAYYLAKAGKPVVVIDQGQVCAGETGRTTAHLTQVLDCGFREIERLHGEAGARLVAASHATAIDKVQSIIEKEGISCDFARMEGYLFAESGDERSALDEELEAARRAGLTHTVRLDMVPLGFNAGPCLRFGGQAQLHPLKYGAGLAEAIERLGGRIYSGAHVKDVLGGSQPSVETDEGIHVSARSIVVATNTPVNDWVAMHTKQSAYRTYVIGVRVPHGYVHPGLYWDTADPYHYLRLDKDVDGDILMVGGEDHKTGQSKDPEECFARLFDWTRRRFPKADETRYTWSGQLIEPVDGLAFIGRNPGKESTDGNVYIATGQSGNGITYGTIAGLLLCDLIQGLDNPWASLYDPARVTLRASAQFARENLNVAAQYTDFVTPGEISTIEELEAGSGALLRDGLTKLAVYRDVEGNVHKFSAVCPHLGCVVQWNRAEQTWDCPCHGSRFEATGKVVNGPALGGLAPFKE